MPEVVPRNIKPVAEGDIFSRLVYHTAAVLALMLGSDRDRGFNNLLLGDFFFLQKSFTFFEVIILNEGL